LRQEKPYIENPDSDKRDIKDLALENWANTLRRDWSFILFLFYGQLKSTLNCQTCNKSSTTFDNFTSIPLSLPEPSKILITVVVYRLPNTLRELLRGSLVKSTHDENRDQDSFRSEDIDEEHTTIQNMKTMTGEEMRFAR